MQKKNFLKRKATKLFSKGLEINIKCVDSSWGEVCISGRDEEKNYDPKWKGMNIYQNCFKIGGERGVLQSFDGTCPIEKWAGIYVGHNLILKIMFQLAPSPSWPKSPNLVSNWKVRCLVISIIEVKW